MASTCRKGFWTIATEITLERFIRRILARSLREFKSKTASPTASWQYAIRYLKNGNSLFSVDGAGNIIGSSAYLGSVALNGDPINGSVDVGNLANPSATPYIDLNGFGTPQNNVRMINDTNGQLTINTATGGNLQVNANKREGSFYDRKFSRESGHSVQFVGALHGGTNWRGCEVYLCLRGDQYLETLGFKLVL
jgi:hypothetical protein